MPALPDYTGVIVLGPYVQGEIPPPLVYVFKDGNSPPLEMDLSGYVGRFEIIQKIDLAVAVERIAVVNPDQSPPPGHRGETTYTWVAADFAVAGDWFGEMWVGNGATRICTQKYTWHTRLAVKVPAI